jgi:transposase
MRLRGLSLNFVALGLNFRKVGPGILYVHYNAPANSSGVVSEYLARRGIPVLSQPPYSLDLASPDFFIWYIKNCDERDKIRGCFINPRDCDEKTKGYTRRSVFSGIRFVV